MKAVFLCLLLLINLFPLGNAVAEDKTTTVMVYLCGSDLQEDACEDLMEMAEVEAGDTINLVVLAGGAGTWDIEDLKGGSRTLAVIRDGYYEVLEDWGPGSMGSPDCLEDFLRYGLTTYPADRTMAILWDHGAGSEGGNLLFAGDMQAAAKSKVSKIAPFMRGGANGSLRERAPWEEMFALGTIHLETNPLHTVKSLQADIPKGRLTVVTRYVCSVRKSPTDPMWTRRTAQLSSRTT